LVRRPGMVSALGSALSRVRKREPVELRPEGQEKGAVLLSYITKPFALKPDDPWFNVHSNMWECTEMARTFLDMGYSVDVIDWDDADFSPKREYSVLIDIHSNMERLAPKMPADCLKILHATGSHWRFQNDAEHARLEALKKRRGASLAPRRIVPPSRAIEFADQVTLLGNEVTESTFVFAGKPIHRLHVSSPVTYPWDESKDFEAARKRFVWFGGSGLVLKGLDIALEAFSQMPELHLTVCGPIEGEKDFKQEYLKELYKAPNIKTVGMVGLTSPEFADIRHSTGSLIYPSASEGQSTSVVVCMHGGLVPVISRRSGVDVDGFGMLLEKCSVEEVKAAARSVAAKPSDEVRSMARGAWEHARARHTRENFMAEYGKVISAILEERSGRSGKPQT